MQCRSTVLRVISIISKNWFINLNQRLKTTGQTELSAFEFRLDKLELLNKTCSSLLVLQASQLQFRLFESSVTHPFRGENSHVIQMLSCVMRNTAHAVCGRTLYFFQTVSRCPHVARQTPNVTTVYEVRQFYCWWNCKTSEAFVSFPSSVTTNVIQTLSINSENPPCNKIHVFFIGGGRSTIGTVHMNELIPELQIRQDPLMTPLVYSV